MPKCPKCKSGIDSLTYTCDAWGSVWIDSDGATLNYQGEDEGPAKTFECPECQYVIAKNDTDALAFLSDKIVVQADMSGG